MKIYVYFYLNVSQFQFQDLQSRFLLYVDRLFQTNFNIQAINLQTNFALRGVDFKVQQPIKAAIETLSSCLNAND